ncbi:MAG: YkgJ family cysteine cluster protein [Planctomycetes bacterium]|nr:YkgJ family cysteine cluster protein [Planctomycetota bacterium]
MIRPSCSNCGACCRNFSSPPLMPDEFAALPKRLKDEVEAYLSGPNYDDSRPRCLWLTDQGTCREYEHRPEICRNFRLAGESCHAQRKIAGLTVEGWPVVSDAATVARLAVPSLQKAPVVTRKRETLSSEG